MSKIFSSFLLAVSVLLVSGKEIYGESQTIAPGVCVQVYGGGVVCGAAAPEHKPVKAGLGENIALIGGGLLLASGVLFYLSKRAKNYSFKNIVGGGE